MNKSRQEWKVGVFVTVSLVLAAALIGLGLGGEADVTPYLLTRYFGLGPFSTLYGFTWTAYAVAGAVGPVMMGRVFDATGSYQIVWIGSILLSVVACAMCVPINEREERKPQLLAYLLWDWFDGGLFEFWK